VSRSSFLLAGFVLLALSRMLESQEPRLLIKLHVNHRPLEGTLLAEFNDQATLLDRQGRLWTFNSREATGLQVTTTYFEPYPLSWFKRNLQLEFGDAFEITAAGQFLVVHPRGQGRLWSTRFDELYRSFWHFFQVRGFQLEKPRFPLVAVVFPSETEFRRYAAAEGSALAPNMLGYYSPTTNRVALFDSSAGRDQAWQQNAEVIIHEATHQTAFNTGIHNRLGEPPRWVVEGLGTLFEARGVWNSRSYSQQRDRINQYRCQRSQELQRGRSPEALPNLIASDRLFDTHAEAAYAEAWALTFYLMEKRPQDYARYLKRTAQRPDFRPYTAGQRLADFTAVFGENLRLFDAQYQRFVQDLRP
jgi:hypothetical protein